MLLTVFVCVLYLQVMHTLLAMASLSQGGKERMDLKVTSTATTRGLRPGGTQPTHTGSPHGGHVIGHGWRSGQRSLCAGVKSCRQSDCEAVSSIYRKYVCIRLTDKPKCDLLLTLCTANSLTLKKYALNLIAGIIYASISNWYLEITYLVSIKNCRYFTCSAGDFSCNIHTNMF